MFTPLPALHIPDGFLSLPVSVFGWLIFIAILGYALRRTQKQFGEQQIPLMGILAAFIFAAQMLNFPVAGGTSGHLLGATLAVIFVGPWAMIVIMTCVIGVQALVFQDGGLLALGFNTINMGVISGLVGYTIYRWCISLMNHSKQSVLIGAGLGAWAGTVVAAVATAVQLSISGTSPLAVALPAMFSVHVLIGIGEALITVASVAFVQQTRSDLLLDTATPAQTGSRWIAIGAVIALALILISPLADPNPDGLEQVAQTHGFDMLAQEPTFTLLYDYTVPFIEDEVLTTIIAGLIGVAVVGGLGVVAAKLSQKDTSKPNTKA